MSAPPHSGLPARRCVRDQRGAQAVEFALVLPILLALLVGIMEFGMMFNRQVMVTQAARAAARSMAIHNSPSDARDAARNAAPSLGLTESQISVTPSTCPPTGKTDVVVTITRDTPFLTGMFGTSIVLKGTGVMRCGG